MIKRITEKTNKNQQKIELKTLEELEYYNSKTCFFIENIKNNIDFSICLNKPKNELKQVIKEKMIKAYKYNLMGLVTIPLFENQGLTLKDFYKRLAIEILRVDFVKRYGFLVPKCFSSKEYRMNSKSFDLDFWKLPNDEECQSEEKLYFDKKDSFISLEIKHLSFFKAGDNEDKKGLYHTICMNIYLDSSIPLTFS